MLVLANQTLEADELMSELQRIDADGQGDVLRLRPGQRGRDRHRVDPRRGVRPGRDDRGRAGAVGPDARGPHGAPSRRLRGLGDYRPLRALRAAVQQFDPDQIVIVTLPAAESIWQRFEVVDRAARARPAGDPRRGRLARRAV